MTSALRPGIGDPAPDLVLPTADDEPFRLSRAHGRPALVSFLSHAA